MTSTDRPRSLAADGVAARLRRASALSDLDSRRRLDAKVPMSAAAVAARLRAQSAARDACLAWARAGAAAFSSGRPR